MSGKIISSLVIFLIFIYITVFICTIPMDFTIGYENGRLTASHIGSLIVKAVNDKFISLMKFDLGRAGKNNQSLNYLVTDIMPNSVKLLMGGILLAIILGTAKGIIDSRRGSSSESNLKVLLTIIPISLPDVLIIALLQRFAIFLNNNGIKVLRVGGGDTISHMVLPIIALSILPA
jgi:ABC-type dipeptide/oligopeptide/nickel transport system permease component